MESDKITPEEKDKLSDEWQCRMVSFRQFLEEHQKEIDQETIFQVLQSHGKIDECIKYAELIQKYDTVIVHYINKQEYDKALEKVTMIKEDAKRHETMLRYASVFMNKCARQTIDELQKQQYRKIEIAKLMPAFMNVHTESD
jgi:hypothetical protein